VNYRVTLTVLFGPLEQLLSDNVTPLAGSAKTGETDEPRRRSKLEEKKSKLEEKKSKLEERRETWCTHASTDRQNRQHCQVYHVKTFSIVKTLAGLLRGV